MKGGSRISAAVACGAVVSVLIAAPAGAHDSRAPEGSDSHPWLPHAHWVSRHWLPYDEARLRALLGLSTPRIFHWLKNDHRTLAQLARRRGVDPRTLATRLLADERAELEPRVYRMRLARTRRMLTQGHLAQHVYFHVFHGPRFTSPVLEWFGVSSRRYRRLRFHRGLPPRTIALRHGRDPAKLRAHAAARLEALAHEGVHHGATSAQQANAMLARQMRVLDCWLERPAPKFDPHNPFGDPYGGHGDHRRASRIGIRHPKPARGCWLGLYTE